MRLASILTKQARVTAPFCERHKGHWFLRGVWTWGIFFLFGIVGFGALFGGLNLQQPAQDQVMPFVCIGAPCCCWHGS